MIDVLGVLMGINMQGSDRPEGSDELPPDLPKSDTNDSTTYSSPKPPTPGASTSRPQPSTSTSSPLEDVEMTTEDVEEANAKKEAEAAKQAGNAAYKSRKFDEAASLFEKAWNLWPKDVTFLTNLGGDCPLVSLSILCRNSRIWSFFSSCLLRARRI
jgi:stress-induced-phosphoprotein 1